MESGHWISAVGLSQLTVSLVLILAPSAHSLANVENTAVLPEALKEEASTLPSLSARHIRFHEPSERELLRADIDLSPHGLRVRQAVHGERHREMLQDFTGNSAWLIDRKRSIAHRLPLSEEEGDAALLPAGGASFLSQQACGQLLQAEKGSTGVWRGRSVQAWRCRDDTEEIVAIEFIDQDYGIVVYRRTIDGLVDELRDLKDRDFSGEHFKLQKGLRAVGKQEFFGGAPKISTYQESD